MFDSSLFYDFFVTDEITWSRACGRIISKVQSQRTRAGSGYDVFRNIIVTNKNQFIKNVRKWKSYNCLQITAKLYAVKTTQLPT
jgi:hypothetical protein